MLRVVLGILVSFVGVAGILAGGVAGFWLFGQDDTVTAEPKRLTSKGVAVVAPEVLLTYYGPTLHISVDSDAPVFVGVAHDTFVQSYLAGTEHTTIAQVQAPLVVNTAAVPGKATRVPSPSGRYWWQHSATGQKSAELAWRLPNGPYDLVVMRADGKDGVDVTAELGIELEGAFRTSLLVFGAGLILLAGGVFLIRGLPSARNRDQRGNQ